jgi:hypothetical protein
MPFAVTNARELLAVVLCPASVFVGARPEEREEAARALRPMKAALIRRFRARENRRLRC